MSKVFTDARVTTIRLWSGLVLFFYVTLHLFNHAIGLISLDAMQGLNNMLSVFWRFLPISLLLYGALALHFVSAFTRLLRRRTLRMPHSEKIQIVLGLAIPFLLVVHVMGTRYASAAYAINDSYLYVLLSTFVFSPFSGVLNALGLVAAWVHGCLGVYNWLRVKRWYDVALHQWLLAAATLLPALALTSFLFNGRAVVPLSADGEFMATYFEQLGAADGVFAMLGRDIDVVRWVLVIIIVGGIAARLAWQLYARRSSRVEVSYENGENTRQPPGSTLLEMSKIAGIPHASVCGGKGRCSTCRVQLVEGAQSVDAPSDAERKVLARFNTIPDVRLACQIRPKGDLTIRRLLPPDVNMASAAVFTPWASGQEKVMTVMFADLRDFTGTTEHRLPFDVVFLVNQFSRAMGETVEENGGRIDKFLGDGFMALFGLNTDPEKGALEAVSAAAGMQRKLDELNERLKTELDRPLRMGIGVHTGAVVLGDMGHGAARGLTAIGDTVNTASRLEAATKDHACAVCISAATIEYAGLKAEQQSLTTVLVRGKTNAVDMMAIQDAADLLGDALMHPA